jgi:hypothetical protein
MLQDLETLYSWFSMMNLSLNLTKTKFILFKHNNSHLSNAFLNPSFKVAWDELCVGSFIYQCLDVRLNVECF